MDAMHPLVTFSLTDALAILRRTPATLTTMLDGLPPAWTAGEDEDLDWSPLSVIGHLVDGERSDWILRTRTILEHGEASTFEPFNRHGMLDRRDETLTERLDAFATLRRDNIARLESFALSDADLERRGTHPEFGSVTLCQLLATWAVHDLAHVAQVAEALARRYTTEVGPWRAYLPVLDI